MEVKSPGGFVFGIQGYSYGEVRPTSVTFFMDGTARVCDHHGNKMLSGTHAEVIAELEEASVNWQTLACAGWPQLPYALLKELTYAPATPIDELMKIKDRVLRADAVKFCKERDAEAAEVDEVLV